MAISSLIDKAIAPFAPNWALRRLDARLRLQMLSTFAAAERDRLNRDRRDVTTSADTAIVPDMATMNSRARAAERDDWCANSIVAGYRRHVVGTGILARSDARDANGKPLIEFNRQADRLFNYWALRGNLCDIERRKSFYEMQGMMVAEFATVGQSFAIKHFAPRDGTSGLAIQVIEPEQLSTLLIRNPDNGNFVRNGVEIDKNGAAVAYHIYLDHHPYDMLPQAVFSLKPARIPADRVMHFMRQNRPRQTHGYTRLSSVLQKLHNVGAYDQYQIVRARYEAAIGMVIETPLTGAAYGNALPSTAEPRQTHDGGLEIKIEPGMTQQLPPGYTAKWNTPGSPGGNYAPFMTQQITEASAGSGLDYATVTRDFSKGSFSAQRQSSLELNMEIDPLQELLIDLVCRPIRDEFVTFEILEGRLDAPGFWTDPAAAMRYLDAQWQPQPRPWIDPANQAAGAKIALDYRLTTRAKLAHEQGEDVRDQFHQINDEQLLAKDLGIGLPEAPVDRGGTAVKTSPFEPKPSGASRSPVPQDGDES